MLIGLSDLVPILEDHIGFKCEETYLEDVALKIIKESFEIKDCDCRPFKYIFIDLDDPTFIIQRFTKDV